MVNIKMLDEDGFVTTSLGRRAFCPVGQANSTTIILRCQKMLEIRDGNTVGALIILVSHFLTVAFTSMIVFATATTAAYRAPQ
jgi:hypothetical protein